MSISAITLYELNNDIKNGLKSLFSDSRYVIAEISEISESHTGHCYLELIEKDKDTDKVIARSRANIWSYTYRMLKPYFETSTGMSLSPGMKVLVVASVEYSEIYGLSLNIKDIDPTYSLGDIEQQRAKILKQLTEDGIIGMNKELPLPTVPKNIAVISSEKAAGYTDFMNQLDHNSHNYSFSVKLFKAVMQGDGAEDSIISALDAIYEYHNVFDLVVITRGGGAVADLGCFDNYNLAVNIAQFPIPVITGIGHDKDDTVIDNVAHQKVKTPTAAAEFIVDLVIEFESYFNNIVSDIAFAAKNIHSESSYRVEKLDLVLKSSASDKLSGAKTHILILGERVKALPSKISDKGLEFDRLGEQLKRASLSLLKDSSHAQSYLTEKFRGSISNYNSQQVLKLDYQLLKLKKEAQHFLSKHSEELVFSDKRVKLNKPENILKKGYTITTVNGKVIKDSANINPGDKIKTKLDNGAVYSTVD